MTAPNGTGGAEESALAAIVRSSHDAVIAKTVDGVVTAWNDGAALVYGYAAEQMLGRSIELTIPAETLAEERARHARVAAGVAESGYRCVRLHADGHRVTVVMSMSPVRDAAGQVIGVASISRPVSDKELADARFSSLLEAAPDAMVCVDTGGRIALVNAQASVLFGYERSELVGQPIELLLPAEAHDRHVEHRADFFRHPQSRAMGAGLSLQAQRRDGSTFPVEVSLAVDTTNTDPLAIAAVRDVTEQRAAQASLRESDTRMRQLAEHVDLVFTLRQIEPLQFLYASPGFQKLTGQDPTDEQLLQSDVLTEMIHPEDRATATAYRDASAAGETADAEFRIIRPDGEVRWLRSFATPVPNPHGPPERVVTTTEDITERKKAAQALEAAEATARAASEAKNEFLSRMSHELRTPLNAVLGFGQLLEHHLQDTPHAGSAHQIVRAGRHLLDLINEVLDISRIEAGEMSLSPEPVLVSDIVQETVLLMQPLADTAGVTLILDGGPVGQYVLADRQRLSQILLNLISNAVKYNHPGGSAWLSWTGDATTGAITVRDDGPGIADELQDRLFTPFDRLGAEGGEVEGTGVGLTVTKGLAEIMHGSVSFESAAGQGTSFTVTLPISGEPLSGAAEGRAADLPVAGTPLTSATLLYIEDNEPNVRVMESVLELRPAWHLIHAGLAHLGIELARAHHPDLVLLDLHLPDGTGLDVLEALQSESETDRTQVVVLSADASHQQVRRLLAAGASRYLTKPLDLGEVLALLDEIIDAKAGP